MVRALLGKRSGILLSSKHRYNTAAMRPLRTLSTVLEMIKIEHTLFALPFAFLGMLLAAEGWPSWRTVGWIVVAMVGARSAAMGFNRLVDRSIDAANPRTAGRGFPAALVTPGAVTLFGPAQPPHAADRETRGQKHARARHFIEQLHDTGGFQWRKCQKQQERRDKLRPNEKRQPHPRPPQARSRARSP